MSKKAAFAAVLGLALMGLLLVGLFLSASMSIYTTTQNQAINAACRNNLKTVDAAVYMYQANKLKDPNMSDLITAGYLVKIPECPTGVHYFLQGRGKERHAACPRGHRHGDQ
ncbi:MAG: hypothetical protein ACM3PP_02385 [Candidatus Saccharibacteria bacterium]